MQFSFIRGPFENEGCYAATLPNGLAVRVYPMPGKNSVYAMLGAKVGSTTRNFKLGGHAVDAPAGVAHFLEHKLFEGEQGDAFSLFAKTGANANAYTSFDRTCYLFSASLHIEESLRTLIRFVGEPHFTAATVQKEQGIIAQEIKMYDDNPDWVLTNMMLRCLYHTHPIRDDIAGTVESIGQITPELLYDCYNAFYRPSNMVLSIAGNIDPDLVARVCEQEYGNAAPAADEVEMPVVDEPQGVAQRYSERRMSIFESQFGFAYKEKPFARKTALRNQLLIRIVLELLAGETSELYRKLYDEGLLNGMFDASALSGEDYLCVAFSGESAQPERVVEALKQEIARQKKEGIDAERFEECRRAILGSELCSFDSVEAVATKMTAAYFKDCGLYDIIDQIKTVTPDEAQQLLKGMLDTENSALAVLLPQGGEES